MLPQRAILAVALSLSVILGPAAVATAKPKPPAPAAQLPAERPYPATLDAPIEYEGMTTCDPVARPGAMLLRQLILDTYGPADVGITRACDQDTISEHKEGRAVDWMVDWKDSVKLNQARAFVDWVTAPGPDGTPAANARRLGIMYIGWADKMWRAYDPARGWTELKGCASKQDSSFDTFCHRDHVHFSMTWDGAAGTTSYWDGTPVTMGVCKAAPQGGAAKPLKAGADFVPISPVRLFDGRTRGQTGCVIAQRRWNGDNRAQPVKVAGRQGIPKTGVKAVAVRVTAYDSNAPGVLTVGGARTGGAQAVSLGQNSDSAGTAIVPVSSTGRIWVSTIAGHAVVAVDVLGYFRSGRAATAAAGGAWHPVEPADPSQVKVDAGQEKTVQLGGAPTGVEGVVLTVNTRGNGGAIRIFAPGKPSEADSVGVAHDGDMRAGTVMTATSDGSVVVRNASQAPVEVTLGVVGWVTTGDPDGAKLRTASASSGSSIKIGSPNADKVVDVPVQADAQAKGVLVAVTTRGKATAGGVAVWGAGERPTYRSVDVRQGRAVTELLMVQLGTDRMLHLAGAPKASRASVRLVAVLK